MLKNARVPLLVLCALLAASAASARQWTDDFSEASADVRVKAQHGQEVKAAIDQERVRCGLAPQDWTQMPYAAVASIQTDTVITSQQLSGLRMAIVKAYFDSGVDYSGVPSQNGSTNTVWNTSDAEPGSRVLSAQIRDMRLALDHLASSACGAPGPSCGPGECNAAELGWTTGGNCGGCNPHLSSVSTIGPGCRTYQCDNGVWKDVGAPPFCEWAASCT